jgi:uncharacterized protein (TIGR00106 family)
MSVMIEFSIVPMGKGTSISAQIAAVMKIVIASGVKYRANPMGTVLEGEWGEVMKVVQECHHAVMKDAERAITSIKIDDRHGSADRIDTKLTAVEQKLGMRLQH